MRVDFKLVLIVLLACLSRQSSFGCNDGFEFKGSFIQPWLVDGWDDDRWDVEMNMLGEAGIEYLVFGPAMERYENGERRALYRTQLVPDCKYDDSLEKCLASAERCGIKVFVGINFDSRWWHIHEDCSWVAESMALGNDVIKEIVEQYKKAYPEALYGWYWFWEVANLPVQGLDTERLLADMLNINLDYIDTVTPDMPFMLSPFMNSRVGLDARGYGEMWTRVFARTHFRTGDIFCPQDCVGAGGTTVENVAEWFSELRKAADSKPGLEFWGNVETFDQRYWISAPVKRMALQVELIRPYVSRLICFAYSHYLSPTVSCPARHKVMKYWRQFGRLPEIPGSEPLNQLSAKVLDDGVKLSWPELLCENTWIDGVSVYRDGKLVNKLQCVPGVPLSGWFDSDGHEGAFYEVRVYNIDGYESDGTIAEACL